MSADVRSIEPLAQPPDATVPIPGSKSLTNRALVCAALADGASGFDGALVSDDTDAMASCFAALGARVNRTDTAFVVDGQGGAWVDGPLDLDARLSGTTSRFLFPVLALGRGPYRLDGGEPLRRRPMGEIVDVLQRLGAEIDEEGQPGHLPVVVRGKAGLGGGELHMAADISSQFVSALLMAAPYLDGGLTLHLDGEIVSRPYLAMTTDIMGTFGIDVEAPDERTYVIPSGHYRGTKNIHIEPDASAASYFFAAAAITGGRVRVEGLATRSVQGDVHIVDVLRRMGAEVTQEADATEVRGTSTITGIDVDLVDMPDMASTIAAVAVFAAGPTRVRGVKIIRGHETDRIRAIATELTAAGIEVDEHDDGWTIHPGEPKPTIFHTYDDHRMAMSLSLLGLRAAGIQIADPGCVAKTFPNYFEVLDQLHRY